MCRAAWPIARRTSGGDARRRVAHLVGGHFERPADAIEPERKPAERAIATLPHAIDDAVDAANEGAVLAPPAREQPIHGPCIGRRR